MEIKRNSTEPEIIQQLRELLKENQKEIKDPKNSELILMNSYSAACIITVYDKISKSAKAKLLKLPLNEIMNCTSKCFK